MINLSGSIFAIEIKLNNGISSSSMLAQFTEIDDSKNGSSMCKSKIQRPFTFPKHENVELIDDTFHTLHFLYRNYK